MKKNHDEYIFKGFGFDILLRNVNVINKHGEEYPDVNLNEIKFYTAKTLLRSDIRLNGFHLKFLRTYIGDSHDSVSNIIKVPASTLRSWENRGLLVTGMLEEQEKAFRIYINNRIIESERMIFDRDLCLSKLNQVSSKPLEIDQHLGADFKIAK